MIGWPKPTITDVVGTLFQGGILAFVWRIASVVAKWRNRAEMMWDAYLEDHPKLKGRK